MNKLAILSDIHANLPAFREVLREIKSLNISEVFLGGDLVGYGASPAECVELAMAENMSSVMGNHDWEAIRFRLTGTAHPNGAWKKDPVWAGVVHAAQQLNEKQMLWLKSQPMFAKPDGAIMVHASLDEPEIWNYIESAETALPTLQIIRGRMRHVAFVGHTHVQRIFPDLESDLQLEQIDERTYRIPQGLATVVTVGAVGQPRGDDFDSRAAWAIWDPVERTLEFRRTEYDVAAAAEATLNAGLPKESALRLGSVKGLKGC
jgi:predicted phosphodiesterase